MEFSIIPELEPVEILGTYLDVLFHSAMLEEKLGISPEAANLVRSGDNPAHELLFSSEFGSLIPTEYLEHRCVHRDNFQLILEIVLVLISPTIDIIRLDINLVWPIVFLLSVSILIEL